MTDKHYNTTEIAAINNNTCTIEEKIAFLEHIAQCTPCAELFAASLAEQLVEVPFKKPNPIRQLQILHQRKVNQYLYNAKILLATVAAVALVFTVPTQYNLSHLLSKTTSKPQTSITAVQKYQRFFSSVSKKINQIEVKQHDEKKEK